MKKNSDSISAITPFGIAAKVVIDKQLRAMMTNLPGTVEGSDIEALHDMRVASRRLRAALKIFKPCFKKKKFKQVEELVKDVTRALGSVRDHDVFLDYLNKWSSDHDGADITRIISDENAAREESRKEMLAALNGIEKSGLEKKIGLLLDDADYTRSSPKQSDNNAFASWAPSLIIPRIDDIRAFAGVIEDPSKACELHQMRIAAKRLRYTLEAFASCFEKAIEDKINAVKLAQEQLGVIHDCDVWMEKLAPYELSDDETQRTATTLLREDLKTLRDNTYHEGLPHWKAVLSDKFVDSLVSIIHSPVESTAEMEFAKAKKQK